MAKYHCGTLDEVCTLYKEDILGALRGVVITHDENEEFPITKQEADKLIIEIFNEVVYQLHEALASGRTYDRILKDKCIEINMEEFIKIRMEESQKYNTYDYGGEDD